MSKGPGKIERAVIAAFTDAPDHAFTVDDLAALAYPGIVRVEKRHRVAVLRAADNVAGHLGWSAFLSQGVGRPLCYFNNASVRSVAIGRLRTDFMYASMALSEIERIVDDPTVFPEMYRQTQPGGIFHQQVVLYSLERAGRHEEAAAARVVFSGMRNRYNQGLKS